MKKILISALIAISCSVQAQDFLAAENDTTVLTEYNDGRLWAYRQIGDYVVGMTNYVEKDDYGKNYQILIFIKNLGETSALFDPSLVTSTLVDKQGESKDMKVYTYERYMKKVKNQQAWAMALTGFAAGMNAGAAGYQTTYTTTYGAGRMPYTQVHTTYNYAAASAANMAATTQMMTLSKMMSDDKKTISQGYLKLTTVHPEEGIIGYMNIKHRKGVRMTVNIPIEGQIFSFDWDIAKKKKK
jgi:hypothetical protein